MKSRVAHTSRLCDQLHDLLRDAIPSLKLNGHPELRLPNTLNVRIPGILSHDLVTALGDTVAISSGSACHADRVAPSTVLTNMGLTDEEALSSVRISLGKDTTADEVREASVRIADAVASLRMGKA